MEPCIEDASPTHSIREPLLDKSNKDEDVNDPDISDPLENVTEADVTIIEQLMGSQRNCYAIGQWIWLSLVWSDISLLPYYPSAQSNDALHLQRVLLYLLAMVGHGFFLVMLAQFPGHQASRLSQVNQETLPAILSGLRVFCFIDDDGAARFLAIIAVVFLLSEICGALYKILVPFLYRIFVKEETHIFHDVETEYYKCHLQRKPKQTTCLEDGLASQETSSAGGSKNNNETDDYDIPKQTRKQAQKRLQWQPSWFAIGQWIWVLSVWFVVRQYLESETSLPYEVAFLVTWAIVMFGHGISLAVQSRCGGNSASLGCINRENFSMILSACFIVSWEDNADDFLSIIAIWCILIQALGAAKHFTLTMIFKTSAEMKKNGEVDGADVTLMEQLIGSRRIWYAFGQWMWLGWVWSFISSLSHYWSYDRYDPLFLRGLRVLAYILAMIGHGFFLLMLARFPGHKASRLAQVNEETLPAILSGLRVFCFSDDDVDDVAAKFLAIIAVAFVLLEICAGSVCPALYKIFVEEETHIFHEMEAEYYKCHLQRKPKQTTCLEDDSALQETSGALGFENENNEIKDSKITKQAQQPIRWQPSWFAIGQWIWVLSVWFVVRQYLESETSLPHEDAFLVTWAIVMFGHGISLAVQSRCGGNSASLGFINRENFPMILSTCFIVSWEDNADDFLSIIAIWCILIQALGAAKHFTLTMIFKTSAKMKKNGEVDGADVTLMEQLIGSRRIWYAFGQWMWLDLVWSFMSPLPHHWSFDRVFASILAMIGHGLFLLKLSRLPGSTASRQTAQVNHETLPAILSGLRVFYFNDEDVAAKFLAIIAAVFLSLELCVGPMLYSALSKILVQETHIFDGMETEYDKCHLQSKHNQTTCLGDGLASQETGGALGYKNNNGIDDYNIPKQVQWQRSWFAIGQWIWLLSVWFVIAQYLVSEISLSFEDLRGVIGAIAMFVHGISLAVHSCCGGNSSSLGCINRENFPMILSACFFFSCEDSADNFMVVIATSCIIIQALGAARRFPPTTLFKSFAKMEKEYFETLKGQEAEDAVQLQVQMERMSHLESFPRRPDLIKGRRKRVILAFYLLAFLLGVKVFVQQSSDFPRNYIVRSFE